MADHSVGVTAWGAGELPARMSTSTDSVRLDVVRGDKLLISGNEFNTSGTFSVSNANSSIYSPSGTYSFDTDDYVEVDILGTSPTGEYSLRITHTGLIGKSAYIRLNILAGLDTTPDAFSLGADRYNVLPSSPVSFDFIRVTGINTSVTASVTNGEIKRLYDSIEVWDTSVTVNDGDEIAVRAIAPSEFEDSSSVTLTIGTVTDTVFIHTNSLDPNLSGVPIPIGVLAGTISMYNDIGGLFGRKSPMKLTDYYKRGGLVPDIDENDKVPINGNISLTDFYDAATKIYFTHPPQVGFAGVNTIDSARVVTVRWFHGTEFRAGFGDEIRDNLEFYFEVYVDSTVGGDITESDLVYNTALNTWSGAVNGLNISCTAPHAREGSISGRVRIYIRHKNKTSYNTYKEVNWGLRWYGV